MLVLAVRRRDSAPAEYMSRGSQRGLVIAAAIVTAALAVFCVRTADERHAFALQFLEQRYRSAGIVVRDQLPAGAVVLSVWDSGAVRFHGRKEALAWEGLDPAWLDRSLAWLEQQGRQPFILVESWEEPGFRASLWQPQRYRQARLAAEVRDRPRRPHLRSPGSCAATIAASMSNTEYRVAAADAEDCCASRAIAPSLFAPTTLQAAIDRLGFVQADPIRSPARAQDLILRHRVQEYRAGDLERDYASLDVEEDYLYAYGFLSRHVWRLLHPRKTVGAAGA